MSHKSPLKIDKTVLSRGYAALSPDECIHLMHEMCISVDEATGKDSDGVTIECAHDQWWGVYVTCGHGKITGYSHGIVDVSNAFLSALKEFEKLHNKNKPSIYLLRK